MHFLPILHESSLHSIAYRHTSSIVGTFFTVGAFSRRLCDAPTQWLAGLSLEEGKSLCQDGLIVPHCLSTCASVTSAWGSQKVMSIVWYNTMAAESAVRANSR